MTHRHKFAEIMHFLKNSITQQELDRKSKARYKREEIYLKTCPPSFCNMNFFKKNRGTTLNQTFAHLHTVARDYDNSKILPETIKKKTRLTAETGIPKTLNNSFLINCRLSVFGINLNIKDYSGVFTYDI